MVSRSDPTHEDAGEEAGSSDIQRIQINGEEYVLIRAEKYQQLLVELESIDSALDLERARTETSEHITEKPKPSPANDTAAKATTHEIGAIESAGEHKGEIYGGIYPADKKPIWFSAAPKVMDHYKAAAWAAGQGGSLPTRKQGDYLTTLKGQGGAFTEIFNRGNSFPAGYVWLAEPSTSDRNLAWCQRLSDGDQSSSFRDVELPVLCVRR